jgi:ADP-heptose:LPS heptosyltransferase
LETALFLGWNALGDTLCTTPVLRAFRRLHPGVRIVSVVQNASFCRILDGNPDVDLQIYSEALHLNGLAAADPAWVAGLPLVLEGPTTLYRFDLRFVCTTEAAFHEHISVGFGKALGIAVESTRPVVALDPRDRRAAACVAPRPYVVFSMRSISNPPHPDGRGGRKDWPEDRWAALAAHCRARGFDVLVLGAENDRRPELPGARLLFGLPIRVVAALLGDAACVVTVENGLAHLAAAVSAATVEIYSDVVPLAWAQPAPSPRCAVLYGDPRDAATPQVKALVDLRLDECLADRDRRRA